MTLLLFEAAGARYGLDIRHVVEVVPHVPLRPIAQAPEWLGGLMLHRGSLTPVVDASTLLSGTSASPRFSSRIVVAKYADADAVDRFVGLLVERATDTVTTEAAVQPTGVTLPDARFLGPMVRVGGSLVQMVRVEEILPASVRAMLVDDDRGV
jgi:chemotaxis-related protein WspB